MTAPAAPLDVACPHCNADPGDACIKPSHEETQPHAKRTRASDAAKRQRAQGVQAPASIADAGKEWAALYRSCRLELEQNAAWTKLAQAQLRTMVLNMAHAETLRETASNAAVVTGSTGQRTAHPLWRVAISLDNDALGYAKALKLTPDSRGQAAPDDSDLGQSDDEDDDEFAALDRVAQQRKKKASRKRG